MKTAKPLKCLLANVIIVRENRDNYDLYSTEQVWELDPLVDNYHKNGFLEVGGIITVDNKKYKILNVSFRILNPSYNLLDNIDIFSLEPDESNCSVILNVQEHND